VRRVKSVEEVTDRGSPAKGGADDRRRMGPARRSVPVPDVAVVGGGPAGVATAYFLRDAGVDVTALEAGGDVGGRTRSVSVAGIPSNTGALFVSTGARRPRNWSRSWAYARSPSPPTRMASTSTA
jgi:cation diffusion facilitator CzcD-associated flavoprotein CzcO